MLFIDPDAIAPDQYIILMLILNNAETEEYSVKISSIVDAMKPFSDAKNTTLMLDGLADLQLVSFYDDDGSYVSDAAPERWVALSRLGFAFMINNANSYLEKIYSRYQDVPDKLTSTLLRYLDLGKVPAADRYVSVADNLEEFKALENELEIVIDELVKDHNKNELPVPQKRQVIADLRGFIAQIKGGYVRLSDLSGRIRPLVRNIADWCKDIGIIGAAAAAAYKLIEAILQSLF